MDLSQYFESTTIKPLLNGSLITSNNRQYRAERVFSSNGGELKIGYARKSYLTKIDYSRLPEKVHCYVFIDITLNVPQHKRPFAKKPSEIIELISAGKIIINKLI